MTLEDLAGFQSRLMTEIFKGNMTPRQAKTIDHSVGERRNAIENEVREVGLRR
jgi:hypothetical protein